MQLLEEMKKGKRRLAVVGLGYVGLPLAVAFADRVSTIGFDINEEKIATYRRGFDPTREVGDAKMQSTSLEFTTDSSRLREAGCVIVAVPTPVRSDKTPDLLSVMEASRSVGRNLQQGSVVIFESTVYPGVTEEICVPILEETSGLICGRDFKVGYSPERVNPGDTVHRLENICKIVSGMDEESLMFITALYEMVVTAKIHKAPSIKVAEAAKLAENAQRDINIAFMNELAMAFNRMGIRTADVTAAMNTKWNALGFHPGLVGGHCIGVDPYYFIYRAASLGYHSQIISAGRRINDDMASYIADRIVRALIFADHHVKRAKVYVLGVTFKENCPDTRNSQAMEVCACLAEYGIHVQVVDPYAEPTEVKRQTGAELVTVEEITDADCMVFLVAHQPFRDLSMRDLRQKFNVSDREKKPVLIDVKSIFTPKEAEEIGAVYWSL